MCWRAAQSRFDVNSQSQTALGDSPWGPTPPPFPQLPRTEFVLTPSDPKAGVLSRDIDLNGKTLRSGSGDAILPKLAGLGKAAGEDNFVVPPRSYGFAVYSDADAPACK